MRRVLVFAVTICSVVLAVTLSGTAHGATLKIQPLMYHEQIPKGGQQKGFVDISNPSDEAVRIKVTVQEFYQVDDHGGLAFRDSEQISQAITPELDEVELMPKDVLHLAFTIDGAKLPSGDVFAALFASTVDESVGSTAVQARVGTLFILENGTPQRRNAAVESLQANWMQTGSGIYANFSVRNTAPTRSSTGFFPMVRVDTAPYGVKEISGPLVFAGRARTVEYRQPGSYFGPIKLSVRVAGGEQSRWLFAMTGYWRWLAPLMAVVLVIFATVGARYKRSRKFHNKKLKKS